MTLKAKRLKPGPHPFPERMPAAPADIPDPGADDWDLPEEWLCMVEERELTSAATDLVRSHKRLLRMHYGIHDAPSRPGRRARAIRAGIPSSIDGDDLRERLTEKMTGDRLYLREDLTLASLARELLVEPHHLSRFLNIDLKTTFSMLVNSHRVNEAMRLLAEGRDDSVLDIAFASGFNSKASFNRIFKKVTGCTPQQYRQSCKGEHHGN